MLISRGQNPVFLCSAAVVRQEIERTRFRIDERKMYANRRRCIKVRPFRDRPRSRQSTARVIKLLSRLSTSARLVPCSLLQRNGGRRRRRLGTRRCTFVRMHLRYDRSRFVLIAASIMRSLIQVFRLLRILNIRDKILLGLQFISRNFCTFFDD